MGDRLKGRIALVIGAGQTPGETVGNGRAVSIAYAREGATVIAADRRLNSAQETVDKILEEGGKARACAFDVTDFKGAKTLVDDCVAREGRIDILHNNVGISLAGGDAPLLELEEDAYDRLMNVNLKGMVFVCKHVIPVMRAQGSGVITNISSSTVTVTNPLIGYRLSKVGVVALTESLAISNAEYGIRVNCILPGLMDTPMSIENRVKNWTMSADEVRAIRQKSVPLKNRVGTAWDVANAATFLASEDAGFITGISLLIDGGRALKRG